MIYSGYFYFGNRDDLVVGHTVPRGINNSTVEVYFVCGQTLARSAGEN